MIKQQISTNGAAKGLFIKLIKVYLFNFVFKYIKIFDFILFSSKLIIPNPLKIKCVPSPPLSKHVSIFFTFCCNLEWFDYTLIHKALPTNRRQNDLFHNLNNSIVINIVLGFSPLKSY